MQPSRATRALRYGRSTAAVGPVVAACAPSGAARARGCRIAGGKLGGRTGAAYLGRCEYPRAPESVAKARDAMRKAMGEWGLGALSDDVVLCVSEAVTNSIWHAHTAFRSVTLSAWYSGATVHVDVIDGDRRRPGRSVPQESDADTDGNVDAAQGSSARDIGRGVFLISQLSTRWGVAPRPPGKRVWFEFDSAPATAPWEPSVIA